MPYDSPLPGGYTPGSVEGIMKLNELTDLCTKLVDRVTSLEKELKQTKEVHGKALTKLVKKTEQHITPTKDLQSEEKNQEAFEAELSALSAAKILAEASKERVFLVMLRQLMKSLQGRFKRKSKQKLWNNKNKKELILKVHKNYNNIWMKDRLMILNRIPLLNKFKRDSQFYCSKIRVEALNTKYPIIDWEILTEESRKYWKIIRVSNITEAYQSFEGMLKGFDREDLDTLWSLVKERFTSAVPTEDMERALWVELKRLYEPDKDDTLWKLQRYMHDPLTWRLYGSCAVHHVSSSRGHDIYMLTEKDYPLTTAVMGLMLSRGLQVEEDSEMARDLVRKIFIEANRPRR
ncbi:hypothetical protein Tco_0052904 [Tanacetum coccineum]